MDSRFISSMFASLVIVREFSFEDLTFGGDCFYVINLISYLEELRVFLSFFLVHLIKICMLLFFLIIR